MTSAAALVTTVTTRVPSPMAPAWASAVVAKAPWISLAIVRDSPSRL